MRQLDLVIKPTLLCNAKCIYCHSLKPSTILSKELLEELIMKYGEFTKRRGFTKGSIYWHGGEPMLPGESFYGHYLELKKTYLGHLELENGMQSNTCLYNNPKIRETILKVLPDKQINACIDPFHPTRLLNNGESYLKTALQALRALYEDGFYIAMVYVVHKRSLEVVDKLYYYFKNLGVGEVLFHPLEEFDNDEYRLTADDLGEFFKRLWEVWEDDGYTMPVNPLRDWLLHLTEGAPVTMCEYSVRSAEVCSLTVSPEGNIYPCPRFQDRDDHLIGNIAEMSFDEITSHPSARIITTMKESQTDECRKCEFQTFCNSGCVITHDRTGKTQWCNGLKSFFRFLNSRKIRPLPQNLRPAPGCGRAPEGESVC